MWSALLVWVTSEDLYEWQTNEGGGGPESGPRSPPHAAAWTRGVGRQFEWASDLHPTPSTMPTFEAHRVAPWSPGKSGGRTVSLAPLAVTQGGEASLGDQFCLHNSRGF